MSRVRSTGNKSTEARLLALLRHARIAGWRRHLPIPGSSDFAWLRRKVLVFVDGCFWHGHQCERNVTPKTNAVAWKKKFQANRARDKRITYTLRRAGWRVVRVWECELKKAPNRALLQIRRSLEYRASDS